jgi:hypothetical protein
MTESYLHRMKQIVLLIILLAGSIFPTKTDAQANEYLLKAGYIEKITHFIEWPGIRNNNDSIFKIAVLGEAQLSRAMEDIFNKVKINNRKVEIVTITNIQELKECHILFIPKIKTSELNKVLKYVNGKPILTISDTDGFAEAGCFINFYKYENMLRFEINQKSMKDAGFIVDYRLLKVSKVLNPVIE